MGVIAAYVMPHPPMAIPEVANERKHLVGHTIAAMREAACRLRDLAPETVFIITPHATSYIDHIHLSGGTAARGSFAELGRADLLYDVLYDTELVDRVCKRAEHEGIATSTTSAEEASLDPGFLIPFHFIREVFAEKEYLTPLFVRCSISCLSPADHYRFGEIVSRVAQKMHRRVAVVASADLSHRLSPEGPYGYTPEGPMFDSMVCGALSSAEFLPLLTIERSLCREAAECGLRSLQIMAGTLDETRVAADLLSYEGPFGVGYAVASFVPTDDIGTDPSRDYLSAFEAWYEQSRVRRRSHEDAFVSLARKSLETYVLTGEVLDTTELLNTGEALNASEVSDASEALNTSEAPERTDSAHEMLERTDSATEELLQSHAGVFVTIRKAGDLRGCIGTIMPQNSTLASEIRTNAIAAGSSDPRFPSVTADELDDLVYEVDVLHEPESCTLEELNPARYGVVVSTPDGRRGLVLPNMEGISSVDEQIVAAALKGGIALGRDEVHYQRFRVARHF